MKVLLAKQGGLEGNAYAVGSRTLIGRDPECDIQVLDRAASRKHACVLEQDDGTVLLRDLASQNGTLVGERAVREALLSPGDEITIGDTVFEYREVDEELVDTRDLDMKLLSGPAKAQTMANELSEEERAEVLAVLQERREAAAAAARGEPCCGDPLAKRARAEGWRHCPACGSALTPQKP